MAGVANTGSEIINLAIGVMKEATTGRDVPTECYVCFALTRFFKLPLEQQLK
jgi:hypothetical protein